MKWTTIDRRTVVLLVTAGILLFVVEVGWSYLLGPFSRKAMFIEGEDVYARFLLVAGAVQGLSLLSVLSLPRTGQTSEKSWRMTLAELGCMAVFVVDFLLWIALRFDGMVFGFF